MNLKYPAEIYPKISVVVTSYNREKMIGKALQSAVDQNYPALEILVLDGGSTDATLDVVGRFRSHISYLRSHKDNGPSAAYNEGAERASGAFIHFLNSDDYYTENTLIKVGEAIIENPQAEVINILSKVISINADGSEKIGHQCSVEMMNLSYGKVQVMHPNSRFFRKDIFANYGYIISTINGKKAMYSDYEFINRLSLFNVKNITLPFIGYIYLAHDSSISFNNNRYTKLKMYDETVFYIEHLFANYNHLIDDNMRGKFNQRYRKAYPRRVVKNLKDGDYSLAFSNIKLGIKKFGVIFIWLSISYWIAYNTGINRFMKNRLIKRIRGKSGIKVSGIRDQESSIRNQVLGIKY